jgi:hypothetical protein
VAPVFRGAYAAIVLASGHQEAGDGGCRPVGPGDLLVHGAFEADQDQVGARGPKFSPKERYGELPSRVLEHRAKPTERALADITLAHLLDGFARSRFGAATTPAVL